MSDTITTVTIISKFDCPWCDRVKKLLRMHGIKYIELKPDPKDLVAILRRFGVKTVPQVFIEDQSHTGCVNKCKKGPDDKCAGCGRTMEEIAKAYDGKRIGGFEETQAWLAQRIANNLGLIF